MGYSIDTIAWSVVVDAITDLIDGGAKIDRRTRVVLVNFVWVKVSGIRPKELFLSYFTKAPLIQFT